MQMCRTVARHLLWHRYVNKVLLFNIKLILYFSADACYRSPCQNGGSCLNVVDDFWCKCPTDYYGKYLPKLSNVEFMFYLLFL